MRRIWHFSSILCSLTLGCGDSNNPSEGEGEQSGSFAVSGTVDDTGSVPHVMIFDAVENQVTTVDVEDGAFTANVVSGDYAIVALSANRQPIGLLIDDGASTFDLDSDTDVGALSLDANTGVLSASESFRRNGRRHGASDDDIDLIDMLALDTEGAGNDVDPTTVLDDDLGDVDGDLVPDLIDNDNNEDGVYDNNQGLELCVIDIDSEGNEGVGDLQESSCFIFDNLKLASQELLNGDGDSMPHSGRHVLAIHLRVPSTLTSLISSVQAVGVPAFADGTVEPAAGGWTFSNYPPAGDSWAAHGYELPLATSPEGDSIYSIWIKPTTDPVPALFNFQVTLTTGTVATFTTRLFYVFNTPPKVNSVDDGTTISTISYPMAPSDPGSFSNPLTIASSGTLDLTADRALEVAGGVEVCGMGYQAHLFYLDPSGMPLNVVAIQTPMTPDTGACDPSVDLVLSLDIATELPATYDGTAVDKYQVDFTVRGPQGDNAAEIFWFTR